MALASETVANKLIELASADGEKLTPMQLIKLVYICHGWTLALTDRQLIMEDIEAWQYGPVISDLYHALKQYKSSAITSPINNMFEKIDKFDDVQESIVEQVYNIYAKYTGIQLSSLTHKKDTPWDLTWNTYGQSAVIPQQWIREHFKELQARGKEKQA
ncbi:MAG: DUF4065 domain-containing protein [Kordiimonadaceae bacterium]|nr:DUF4065 domain-containing protein [Kordiimonadaceae bacterium]MBO6569674.1 DUF4065 domain-containing protein [Kordiimonadaceae bacterium]MBO6966209.1 DUF4065 domain-containing protein [Kordiimonadaceae bacterium]